MLCIGNDDMQMWVMEDYDTKLWSNARLGRLSVTSTCSSWMKGTCRSRYYMFGFLIDDIRSLRFK
jgi:hypothetical protein